ncbi:MAG: molybdate ABC transporter substrate-binding protein [Chloroflexota bacterium]|nr:molybdate ABC transporter substrate-binding protein [Chloroflexota bacterium]
MKTPKSLVMTLVTLFLLVVSVSIIHAQETRTLTVFAAASLTDAFEEVATVFEAANPGTEVLYNFASSSDLAIQLSEGAPADVFASANNRQMTVARDAGRIAGRPVTFARNRLVLIVPVDNPAGITTLRDLANSGVRLIVAAPDVPVRDYTDTMLERLAADPAYGEDYRAAVIANVVSEEQNVRQVSAKIALGEGDAGIVYTSDVTPDIAEDVIAIPIPDYLNTIATYPIAVTNDAAQPELAQIYIDFLLSDEGQALLVKWNFITVTIQPVPYVVTLPGANDVVTIDGQVLNPYQLDAATLPTLFSPRTLDVTYLSGEDTVSTTFTGALLWQIISQAQPNLNADVRNDRVSMFIVVTGSDGYQAVISWAEIDPEFAGQPILLAYKENGAPIADAQGPLRLVVPSDTRGGRYVSGVVNISLRDAPGLGE